MRIEQTMERIEREIQSKAGKCPEISLGGQKTEPSYQMGIISIPLNIITRRANSKPFLAIHK